MNGEVEVSAFRLLLQRQFPFALGECVAGHIAECTVCKADRTPVVMLALGRIRAIDGKRPELEALRLVDVALDKVPGGTVFV